MVVVMVDNADRNPPTSHLQLFGGAGAWRGGGGK